MRARYAVVLTVACASFACSSSTIGSPAAPEDAGSSDAGVAESSTPEGPVDASVDSALATCNELTQRGSPVKVINTQSAAPAPTGGVIADGTYVLTTAKMWGSSEPEGSSPGSAAAQTWSIRGTALDTIDTTAKAKTVSRSSGTIAPAGKTELTLTRTCSYPSGSAGATGTTSFTATATTLTLYNASGVSTFELTYTKQ